MEDFLKLLFAFFLFSSLFSIFLFDKKTIKNISFWGGRIKTSLNNSYLYKNFIRVNIFFSLLSFFVFLFFCFQKIGLIFPFLLFCFLFLLLYFLGSDYFYYASDILNRFLNKNIDLKIKYFANLYIENKYNRKIFINVLLLIFSFVFVLDLLIFTALINEKQILFFSFLLFFLFFFFYLEYSKNFSFVFSVLNRKEKSIEKIIKNLSIKAGLEKPILKIIKSNDLLVFSAYDKFKKNYILYFSDKAIKEFKIDELKTIIAWNLSSIASGQIFDFHILNYLFISLKTLSLAFLFMFFRIYFEPFAFLFLFFVFLFYFDFNLKNKFLFLNRTWSATIFIFLTPVLSVLNFVEVLVYSLLASKEIFYNDLNLVLLNKTEHIFGILNKAEKNITLNNVFYLRLYYPSYFKNDYFDFYFLFPNLKTRKLLFFKLESITKNFKSRRLKTKKHCSLCHNILSKKEIKFNKNKVKINECSNCQGVWKSDYRFSYLVFLNLLDNFNFQKSKINYLDFEKYLICSSCGGKLKENKKVYIFKNLKIWQCPYCQSFFAIHNDIYEYGKKKKGIK